MNQTAAVADLADRPAASSGAAMDNDHSSPHANCDLCGGESSDVIGQIRDYHRYTAGSFRLLHCRHCGLICLDNLAGGGMTTSEVSETSEVVMSHRAPPETSAETPSPLCSPEPRKPAGADSPRDRFKLAALGVCRGYPVAGIPPGLRLAGALCVPFLVNRLNRVPLYCKDGKLLDAGCGNEQYVVAMARLGWRAVGLDPDSAALRRRQPGRSLPMVGGRIEESPFVGQSFDVITLWHALEHTHSPAQALREANRLLRRRADFRSRLAGSRATASTLAASCVDMLDRRPDLLLEVPNVESVQARLFGRYWFHLDPPRHRYHFSPATIRGYLAKSGFRHVRVRQIASSVGLTGSLQIVANLLTGRRGTRIRESRLLQVALWPFAAFEAALGRGGCLQVSARSAPSPIPESTHSRLAAGDEPILSVVIVTWNSRPHLQACLASLLPAIEGLLAEIVVVDNDSSDDTVQRTRDEFPDVRLIRMTGNSGFSRAANMGIAASAGRYVWLLNPDTIVHRSTARQLVACLDGHARAGAAGPRLAADGSTDSRSARGYPTLLSEIAEKCGLRRLAVRLTALNMDWEDTRTVPLISGAAMCIRRQALEEVGPLDEDLFLYCEDLDICRRLSTAGWEIWYTGGASVTHPGAGSSRQCPDEAGVVAILSMAAYLRKHHGRLCATVYRAFIVAASIAKTGLFALLERFHMSQARRAECAHKVRLHRRIIGCVMRGL